MHYVRVLYYSEVESSLSYVDEARIVSASDDPYPSRFYANPFAGSTPSDLRHDLTDPCAPSPTPYFGPHNYQRVTQIRQLPLGSLTENGLKIELEHPPSQWFPFHEAASVDTPVNAPPPVAPISYRTPDRNQHITMQSQVNSLHAQQGNIFYSLYNQPLISSLFCRRTVVRPRLQRHCLSAER